MKRMRKLYIMSICLILLIVCLIVFFYNSKKANDREIEIINNGNFVQISEDGMPESWHFEAYLLESNYTEFKCIDNAGPNEENVIYLSNKLANDSRIVQRVQVEPNCIYCLSGLIKANTNGGYGANLSIGDSFAYSDCLFDTSDNWQKVTLYGITGNNQNTLSVFCRLGGYSGETIGEAWFTNISLKKIQHIPQNVTVQNLFISERKETSNTAFDLRYVLLSFCIFLLLITFYYSMKYKSNFGLVVFLSFSIILYLLLSELANKQILLNNVYAIAVLKYVIILICAVSIMLALYFFNNKKQKQGKFEDKSEKSILNTIIEKNKLDEYKITKIDKIIILCITVAYTLLAYINLGSIKSPQSPYVFTKEGKYVLFDLNDYQKDFQMLYFGGIHQNKSDFSIEVSDDGINWRDKTICPMDEGDLFQWLYANNSINRFFSGKYIRLTANYPMLTLYEVIFRDAQGNRINVSVVDSSDQNVDRLLDEQDTLFGEPSWYNSMYFDEIYHARTGYEFLHGLNPYEISHPPLGKVLMSLSIAIFGMTPFGWRFAGATCGVLMLPCMYLLGKLLFRKRRYGILASMLLALDTMHFTQTRIATIDSFVVLFIIWSIYFMLRWFNSDIYDTPFWQTLLSLALSGIFMGLAIASKWTGCFAGVGLALIFFYGIWRKEKKIRQVKRKLQQVKQNNPTNASHLGHKRILISICSCFFFFIVIPMLIYYCSYIPYFSSSGGVTVSRVIDAANYILKYHSQQGFGMNHPYYSPWYQWPLSEKPMYYASHQYTKAGYTYSIFAFGNYSIWWIGFGSILIMLFMLYKCFLNQYIVNIQKHELSIDKCNKGFDERAVILLVCYLSQYLPWILVPRGTYIYHYFPSVPFAILCITYVFERLDELHVLSCLSNRKIFKVHTFTKKKKIISLAVITIYLIIVSINFVAFFPLASGITVPRRWMEAINWFGYFYY